MQIADRDHVFVEYLDRETSAAIGEAFRGFSGYVQADAKNVFDAVTDPGPPYAELELPSRGDAGDR